MFGRKKSLTVLGVFVTISPGQCATETDIVETSRTGDNAGCLTGEKDTRRVRFVQIAQTFSQVIVLVLI